MHPREKKLYGNIIKNKKQIVVAHCSTGYIQSISEVMKNPATNNYYQKLKLANEAQILMTSWII